MSITELVFNKSRVFIAVIVVCMLMGVNAFLNMPQAQDPGFPIRAAQIVTEFPGASPLRVESLVTETLETALQELPEVDYISSQSKAGVSIVTVNVKDQYDNLRPIWDSLRRKVDSVQNQLPEGTRPSVVNDEFGDTFGIVISILSEGFDYAELKQVADEVSDALRRLSLVAKIDILGAQDERVFVDFSVSQFSDLKLSPAYVAKIINDNNIINPGGEIVSEKETLVVEPSGNLESIEKLQQSLIPIPSSGQLLPLGDIANVYRSYVDPPRSIVRTNGQASLTLAISMVDGGNLVNLGTEVKNALNQIQQLYPWGIEFEVVSFQPNVVRDTVDNFVSNLLQAIAVVTIVMLVTLGLRTGLVVASLIPVCVLTSLAIMYALNIGLDQVSLAALMIALGMLVDNSIVMCENILVQLRQGVPARKAAIASAKELQVPLLISSLTTAAAFLPIYLAESTAGEYTAPLFKVVTIALLSSWVLSITMIPLFCALFLKVKTLNEGREESDSANGNTFINKLNAGYSIFLMLLLRNPIKLVCAVMIAFVVSIAGLNFVPKMFFPPSEDPRFTLELELPMGSPIYRTEAVVKKLDTYLQENLLGDEGLKNWVAYVGNGGPRYILQHSPRPASPNYAMVLLNVSDAEFIAGAMDKLDKHLFENYPDLKYSLRLLQSGAAVSNPIEVRISGTNVDSIYRIANRVKNKMAEMPGITSYSDDWGNRSKTLSVDVDQARAQSVGITNTDVAFSLQATLSGVNVTTFREGDDLIPVVMRAQGDLNLNARIPKSINVFSSSSFDSFPMQQVATPELKFQPSIIFRRDGLKTLTVRADLSPSYTATDVNAELTPWLELESQNWPVAYRWELGGEFESSGKSSAAISDKLPIAGFIIFILLLSQFNSVKKSAIILLTIPMGVIGVVIGLLLARSYFGFFTLLGIISLSGIVINNAIVLLDRIDIENKVNGLPLKDAIVAAAERRLRPILLTTATTVLGMIPLWLGGGVMWEPMAVAIIFGLLAATVLTLGVVPVLFSLFYRVRY